MPVSPLSLQPKDAIAFFRSKGMRTGFDYRDVWQQEHAQGFTVAKAMQVDILTDIRRALDDAMTQGKTLEQFKKELSPILQAKGWWGRQEVTDPLTGETKLAQLGSSRRLRTIYEVNLQSAYAHGNWQRIEASKRAFPYLMYVCVLDSRTRPQHRAWHGVCRPVDDPFWDTHYPPCGWKCRCGTRSLTRAQVKREGIDPTAPAPRFPMDEVTNPRTGEVSRVEQGIDPAFNFNIGKSPLRPITAQPMATSMPAVPKKQLAPAVESFLKSFGAEAKGRILQRDNWPLAIGRELFQDDQGELKTPRPDLLGYLLDVANALLRYDSVEWLWGENAAKKAVLIRRYTKRLDKSLVTIDFSDGAWTYDVRALSDG
ncbi:hypothetical protein MMA231_00966 [Asticcacaulis sp. MM231]|uniref:phage head morphogenesis protein n=1 Tax=Asticcacaulis sp. MM231 TaxID=3157666 RepID=UPI0032D5A6AA